MQWRVAITEVGEFRRNDHAPDVLQVSCPVPRPVTRGFSHNVEPLEWLLERAKRKSLIFEAGIRFQKCVETDLYWFGSGQGRETMKISLSF